MATITAVAALDTLDEGRVKWNTNDTNLNNAIAATDALFATHVGTGTGSGHATYAAYEARIAALEANTSGGKIIIPFSFNGTDEMATIGGRLSTASSGIPIPPGTISKLYVASATGTIAESTATLVVSSASIITVDKAALGGTEYTCMVMVGGASTAVVAGFAAAEPIYGTIVYIPS